MEEQGLSLPFLVKGSEVAKQMHASDWSKSGIGMPAGWTGNLKAILSTMLQAPLPMHLFWGRQFSCFYNDAFTRLISYEQPFLPGKKIEEVWPGNHRELYTILQGVVSTGQPVMFEDSFEGFQHSGNSGLHHMFSYSAVTDETGKVAGVLAIFTETNEKTVLIQQLQESKRSYEFAIDVSELGTWDLNPLTKRFTANKRLKEWFGFGPDKEIALQAALDAVSDKDRQRVADAIAAALADVSGKGFNIECTIINRVTGQERVVRAKGRATFDEDGTASRLNGTLQDITTEVRAQSQNQKLSVLVENSVDLMAILRMDGKNGYINSAGRQLLGIEPDADVTQIPITDFHTPEQFEFVASEIIPSVMSKGKWSGQFAIKHVRTGEIIPLYNNCHRIDDDRTGEPIGVGTVMRDMRSELNIRERLEEQVKERTKELMNLNMQLEQKNKDLSSFAFVSSHDLQEPLRKISTYISRIEEDGEAEINYARHKEYFARIKASANRMQTLINDLLAFSSTTTKEKEFATVDLNSILYEIKRDFHDSLHAVEGDMGMDELPMLNAIPFQVKQLFTNLVSNSIKFSRKGVPLRIHIAFTTEEKPVPHLPEQTAKYYCIRFSDNGIGFDDQYAERIFEVFQRLHSKDVYEGTGIGLSICKRIMENNKGFIRASGKPNEGAVFSLYFPV